MGKNKLLVVIVSYNSMPWAETCYKSLRSSIIPCDVITIDNGSSDGTLDFIRKKYPEVRIIETGSNLGFGKANNIGLQIALDEGYDYVYLLNQDAWVKPMTFKVLIEISKRYPEYGVLSPIQMQANEEHLDYGFVNWVISGNQKTQPQMIDDMYFGRMQELYEVEFVMAAHWLITRKCLETVGGFSPTFPHYGEDDNYLQRVKFWKMKVGIVPTCLAIHDRADRTRTLEQSQYYDYYIDKLKQVSNPIWPVSVKNIVKDGFRLSWRGKDKALFKYTWRILMEKNSIKENLQRSLNAGAFLEV